MQEDEEIFDDADIVRSIREAIEQVNNREARHRTMPGYVRLSSVLDELQKTMAPTVAETVVCDLLARSSVTKMGKPWGASHKSQSETIPHYLPFTRWRLHRDDNSIEFDFSQMPSVVPRTEPRRYSHVTILAVDVSDVLRLRPRAQRGPSPRVSDLVAHWLPLVEAELPDCRSKGPTSLAREILRRAAGEDASAVLPGEKAVGDVLKAQHGISPLSPQRRRRGG